MILSIVSHDRKNNIFNENNLKLTKNNTFDHVFCKRIFFTIAPYQFLKSDWIFINHGLFFQGKYSLQFYCF